MQRRIAVSFALVEPRPEGRGLGAAAHPELRQQVADVVLHGLLGQEELLADLTVRESLRDEIQDPSFLAGEGVEGILDRRAEAVEHLGDDITLEQGLPRRGPTDRVDELGAPDLLEQVARCPGQHRCHERIVVRMTGEHETCDVRVRGAEIAADGDARMVRVPQPDVQQRHVGWVGAHSTHGLLAGCGLPDDLDVVMGTDQVEDATSHELVIVEQEDLDRHRAATAPTVACRGMFGAGVAAMLCWWVMDDSRSRHGQRSDDTVHNGEPAASSLRVQELVAAIMAPSSDLDLQSVLQRIVDTAKSMVDARYAALGVLDASGAALSDFVYVGIDPESADRIGQLPQGRGILGELVRNPRTLRLDDLTTDPNSCGFPPGHPPMHSFLGVPILIDGREYGNLYLTDKAGGASFTIEDETVVVLLAGAAGAAIRNARQYERLLRHARWLEATTAITSRLLTGAPTADVLDEIARVAHQLVGADECGVRLADSANEVLTLTAAAGVRSEDAVGEQLPIEGTFLGGVHRTGTTASAPDLGEIAPDDVLVATRGVGPILAVPLVAPQRVLGTLSLSRYRGRPSFEPWDLDLIESFAGQAALALAFNETQDAARADDPVGRP